MNDQVLEKLKVLSNSAKYDVSCASSGISRKNTKKSLGNATGWGICHSYTEDGRCISLFKVMLTNHCIYNCAYCVSRRTNDIPRKAFTVKELVDVTIGFYRRNYIEGLFLSSGVMKDPDYTMERMVQVVKGLRLKENYNGYIHMKTIPGANQDHIQEAGYYADRLSVNIEMPTEQSLKYLAPDKNYKDIMEPMNLISRRITENKEERKKSKLLKRFTAAGQSTQLIIGATADTDRQILTLSSNLYQKNKLKRVYYSGYLPVNSLDNRLPALTAPPFKRENRLYQADWLFRFYHFTMDELVSEEHPDLDLDLDPKLAYALRHPEIFPININKADYPMLLRIPGLGPKSAQTIIVARKYRKLTTEHLKRIGVVMKRARYFITSSELPFMTVNEVQPEYVRKMLAQPEAKSLKPKTCNHIQLRLFD